MKSYTKKEFSSSVIAEMLPGESIIIECANAREVQNVRSMASQYKRLNNPEGIARYGSFAILREDGSYAMELIALSE